MKIKEFYSSGIKENGKIDLSFICDNDKQFRFLNCEIYDNKDLLDDFCDSIKLEYNIK